MQIFASNIMSKKNILFPVLVYLNVNGGKKWMADYHGHDCFFVEAEHSHHGYVSTSSNN